MNDGGFWTLHNGVNMITLLWPSGVIKRGWESTELAMEMEFAEKK